MLLGSVLTLAAGSALASESGVKLTDEVRTQISTMLTGQGYEVGKIKTDDGLYEAYARKDGKRYEVYLNEKMEIVKTKEDD
ncbi:PepSY domain-containing protein [Sedimentitalea sp. CAU 1593]|uniref:PepSY domain-containing protein n=2 Tax=Sedimentitalea arenosa TaxID=2798803 RepID=A0A8J7IJA9_9RHOB|nr:PepSY domain-containing protein [Arenibacterium arenosum]